MLVDGAIDKPSINPYTIGDEQNILLPAPQNHDVHNDGYVGPRLGSEVFVLSIQFAHFTGCPGTRTAFLFV